MSVKGGGSSQGMVKGNGFLQRQPKYTSANKTKKLIFTLLCHTWCIKTVNGKCHSVGGSQYALNGHTQCHEELYIDHEMVHKIFIVNMYIK